MADGAKNFEIFFVHPDKKRQKNRSEPPRQVTENHRPEFPGCTSKWAGVKTDYVVFYKNDKTGDRASDYYGIVRRPNNIGNLGSIMR